MEFYKTESLGNDYIIFDNILNDIDYLKENKALLKKISNRNSGVGTTGIIFLEKSKNADYKISVFNQDSSVAPTSGNAIMCVSKYLYEMGYLNSNKFLIETNRINEVTINIQNNSIHSINVNLGVPSFDPKKIPVLTDKNIFINEKLKIINNDYNVSCLSIGNSHAVFFGNDINNLNLDYVGPFFGYHYKFPDKINVTLAEIIDKNKISIRLYEKGLGEIKSCGTASAASVVAAYYNNKINKNEIIKVVQPGGVFDVIYKDNDETIISGNAKIIYKGKVLLK